MYPYHSTSALIRYNGEVGDVVVGRILEVPHSCHSSFLWFPFPFHYRSSRSVGRSKRTLDWTLYSSCPLWTCLGACWGGVAFRTSSWCETTSERVTSSVWANYANNHHVIIASCDKFSPYNYRPKFSKCTTMGLSLSTHAASSMER